MTTATSECRACRSANVVELLAETCLRFPGLSGLNTEPIFVYPRIVLCTDCGLIWSTLSGRELEHVRKGALRINAASA